MPKGRLKLRNLPRTIAGYIYVLVWVWRARARHWAQRWAIGLLAAFVVFAAIEVIIERYGLELGTSPVVAIQVLFFLLIFVSLYSKIREWREQRQQLLFIQAAKNIVRLLSAGQPPPEEEAVPALLEIFVSTFSRAREAPQSRFLAWVSGITPWRRREPPHATVVRPYPEGLRIAYFHPPSAQYVTNFVLPPGAGGAGFCFENRCVVYIPRKSFGHAILQNIEEDQPYELEPDLFVPSGSEEFQAILSVPLVAYGECYGTLNFDSKAANAFHRLHFEQAVFFGFVLAQLLHENQRTATRVP